MITYGKTIFSTYTYSRDRLLDDVWKGANNDFNRYIQRLRRLHANGVQYLRTVEAHNDGYPHFHAVLRFNTVLTITNSRYFDKALYKRWKHVWRRGHSDYQIPRSKQSPLAYIIKYATKNSGIRIWKKYYQTLGVKSAPSTPGIATSKPLAKTSVSTVTPLSLKCQKYKIKQCTWSRNFFKELHIK